MQSCLFCFRLWDHQKIQNLQVHFEWRFKTESVCSIVLHMCTHARKVWKSASTIQYCSIWYVLKHWYTASFLSLFSTRSSIKRQGKWRDWSSDCLGSRDFAATAASSNNNNNRNNRVWSRRRINPPTTTRKRALSIQCVGLTHRQHAVSQSVVEVS